MGTLRVGSLRKPVAASLIGLIGAAGLAGLAFGAQTEPGSAPPPIPVDDPVVTTPDGREIREDRPSEDEHRWPEATSWAETVQIGEKVKLDEPPPGIQPDGSHSPSETPSLVPVAKDGFVIGFAQSAQIEEIQAVPPGGVVPRLQIVDRGLKVIGEFGDDGLPYLFSEQGS